MTVPIRRFEMGECANYTAVQGYLLERGIKLSQKVNSYQLVRGRSSKMMKWPEVIKVVDGLRVAEGKQPFVRT